MVLQFSPPPIHEQWQKNERSLRSFADWNSLAASSGHTLRTEEWEQRRFGMEEVEKNEREIRHQRREGTQGVLKIKEQQGWKRRHRRAKGKQNRSKEDLFCHWRVHKALGTEARQGRKMMREKTEGEDKRRRGGRRETTAQPRRYGAEKSSLLIQVSLNHIHPQLASTHSDEGIFKQTNRCMCQCACVLVCTGSSEHSLVFASTPDIDILYFHVFQAVSDAPEKLHQQQGQMKFLSKARLFRRVASHESLLPSAHKSNLSYVTGYTR